MFSDETSLYGKVHFYWKLKLWGKKEWHFLTWFGLKNQIGLSMTKSKSDLANYFINEDWFFQLDYVANILHKLNKLNVKLHDIKLKYIDKEVIKLTIFLFYQPSW